MSRYGATGALIALAIAALAVLYWRPPVVAPSALAPESQASDLAGNQASADDGPIERLLDRMGDPEVDTAVQARDALEQIGESAVRLLIERLRHPEPGMRAAAALVLGKIADPRAVGPLCEILGDPDELVRFRAVYALGQLKSPEAATRLAPLLIDPSEHVVNVTIRALEDCHCKVRVRNAPPGYEILPLGQRQWRAVTPAGEAIVPLADDPAPGMS